MYIYKYIYPSNTFHFFLFFFNYYITYSIILLLFSYISLYHSNGIHPIECPRDFFLDYFDPYHIQWHWSWTPTPTAQIIREYFFGLINLDVKQFVNHKISFFISNQYFLLKEFANIYALVFFLKRVY